MKRLYIALGILTLLIAFCVFGLFFLDHLEGELSARLTDIEQTIASEEYEQARLLTESFCAGWDDYEARFSAFVRHDLVERITSSVARLPSLLQYEDYSEFTAEVAKIKMLLRHIRDSEMPMPRNLV